jgi:hypothetical protein
MKLVERKENGRTYLFVEDDNNHFGSYECGRREMEIPDDEPMSLEEYVYQKSHEYDLGVEEDKKFYLRMSISREKL